MQGLKKCLHLYSPKLNCDEDIGTIFSQYVDSNQVRPVDDKTGRIFELFHLNYLGNVYFAQYLHTNIEQH